MIFTRKYTFAALACLSLAIIPVVRSATIDVVVGGPGLLKYDPEFVNASVGDVIRFTFKQKNHTVTQSTLESPCSPLSSGFDSGFVPVADSVTSGFPQAQLTVEKTDPVWIYCRQANHCQQGMVFAVNPGDKFEAFKAAATGNNTSSTTATSPAATGTGVVTVTATVTVSNGQTITTTYGSYPGSSAPTAATSQDHKVVVGGTGGKLTFEPANITAQAGDTVTFEFRQKNHTATQSSFDQPCQPLSPGFDSGFMAVADSATTFPSYTIQINDTKPIWAYCRQGNHCASGMVFSVNAVESGPNNFEAFKAKATNNNSSSGNSGSTGNNNAALSTKWNGAGIAVAVVGVFLGALIC
ncbi:hypothetical protein V5O48_001591 [Marasmius crinis-equi]|uniref:Cupredoxin n=1 Tax=Marasmius crinis-equi TaxID=585013 RepID=A0ABR3FYR3_9AGAR